MEFDRPLSEAFPFMVSYRRWMRGLAALATTVMVAGCGPREKAQPAGQVTLEFFNYASPEFLALYNEKLIPAFEKKHPNIKIRMVTSMGDTGYDAKLLTLIAGKIAPDLIHVTQQNFAFWASKGVLLSLDDYAAEDPHFREDDFYPQVMKGLQFQDQLMGLPSDFSTIVMFYNKDMFDRLGIAYPEPDWTWNDFLQTAKALTHDSDGDGRIDTYGFANSAFYNRWPAWIWMNGGDLFNADVTQCTMDTPEAIGGMQFYVDLSLKHRVAPTQGQTMGQDFEDMFASQTVGMIADSRFAYKRFLKLRGLKFQWDLAPMPRGQRQGTTFIWGANCILKSTEHPKEAWEFLKFLSGPEGAAINIEGGNALPAYRKAAEEAVRTPMDPKTPKNDRYFLDAVAYGRTAPYPPQYAEYNAALTSLHDCFMDLKPVDKACRDFTREVNDILEGKVF